jgi:acyl-CoA synthetase (AMP-forming)/AMP-acid ligase II
VRKPGRWDLSSLRVALNAAEMVRPTTLAGFAETFALPRVMVPGYGLAEATVGVSMQPPGTTPPVDERGFVAIGRPFAGVRLAVLDGARELGDGEVGELAVASPAVTTGYRDDPEATAALFWRPGWIRTGDLAYRRPDGGVFLIGRVKNLIIQGGRSLAPAEVEAAVEELGFVRRAAAIGIDRGRLEGEQAEVLVELRRAAPPDPSTAEEMVVSVVEAVAARLGMRPARVGLLRPKSLPLTDTGKVRHGELRRRLLSGELAADGAILYPEA